MPALYSYQSEGVRWLREKGSGLLADEMGCGKTPQAILALDAPALVVCPAFLRENWRREIATWRPDISADVTVVGYEEAVALNDAWTVITQGEWPGEAWKTLVVDEAHYVKNLKLRKRGNRGSGRGKTVAELRHRARRIILLTGTPILNLPLDLYPLLALIDREAWPSEWSYCQRYCGAKQKKIGWDREKQKPRLAWDFSGRSNEAELHRRVSGHYMLRRTQEEVLPDLPEKRRTTVLVDIDGGYRREYDRAAKHFLRWVADNGGPEKAMRAAAAEALTQMGTLRRLCALGKVTAAVQWIADHYESTGRPLVVMGHHAEVLDRIDAGAFEQLGLRIGRVSGSVAPRDRQIAMDAFQAGELDVLVCAIAVAGVGVTLTRASEMLIVERSLRPSDMAQAEARIHRITQQRSVTITYMDAVATIDEDTAELLEAKAGAAAAIVDGKNLDEEALSAQIVGTLVSRIKARVDFLKVPKEQFRLL